MKNLILRFLTEEDGPTAVEYAVLLALILVSCMAAVKTLAFSTAASYDGSAAAIQNALNS